MTEIPLNKTFSGQALQNHHGMTGAMEVYRITGVAEVCRMTAVWKVAGRR